MRIFYTLGVVLVLFLFSFEAVEGVIIDKVYNINQRYVGITSFGFLKGGTLDANITSGNRNVWFLICSTTEMSALFNYNPDVCGVVSNSSCTLALSFTNSLAISQFSAPQYGMYYVELINCDDPSIQATVHMVLLNPDSDHLSFSYIPYPDLFAILCIIWIAFIVVWVSNLVLYRTQPSKVNRMMITLPIIKIVYCSLGIFYWKTYSIDGTISDRIADSFVIFIILQEAIFYAVLMLIACGWGILTDHLKLEKYIIIAVVVGLIGTRALGYFVNWLFILMSFLTYIIIIVMIFRFVNFNLHLLHIQLRDNPPPISNDGSLRNPIAEKESKLKTFKFVILAFIALVMTISLFQLLLFRDYPWVSDMLYQLLDLMTFISIGYIFRLQDPTAYYLLGEDDDNARVAPL